MLHIFVDFHWYMQYSLLVGFYPAVNSKKGCYISFNLKFTDIQINVRRYMAEILLIWRKTLQSIN